MYMSMCVCMCLCMSMLYVYLYVCAVSVCTCVCVWLCMYACMHVFIYVCTHACMLYVFMYTCMYVYISTYVHTYIQSYIHTYKQSLFTDVVRNFMCPDAIIIILRMSEAQTDTRARGHACSYQLPTTDKESIDNARNLLTRMHADTHTHSAYTYRHTYRQSCRRAHVHASIHAHIHLLATWFYRRRRIHRQLDGLTHQHPRNSMSEQACCKVWTWEHGHWALLIGLAEINQWHRHRVSGAHHVHMLSKEQHEHVLSECLNMELRKKRCKYSNNWIDKDCVKCVKYLCIVRFWQRPTPKPVYGHRDWALEKGH